MRTLSKILGILLFVLCAFQVSAKGKTLEQYVAEEAAQCPKDLGNGLIAEEVTFDGEDIDYVISVTDEAYAALKKMGADSIQEMMLQEIKNDPMTEEMLKRDVSAGMIFVRKSDGEGIPVIMTPNDFRGAIYGRDMKYYLTYLQERCPMEISEGMKLIGADIEDGIFMLVIETTPGNFTEMEELGEKELQKICVNELRKMYIEGNTMLKAIVDKGLIIGIDFNNDDKDIIVTIFPSEFKK